LLRFGVPLFFFRAGFLMAETDDHYTFGSRALKKLKMLVMPYVAWGLIAVLVTYFLLLWSCFEQEQCSIILNNYQI
jgi:fucose 4-O-acetylase-like acetyltransferase